MINHNKEITLRQAAVNNLYAIKLLYSMSRRRVIHTAVKTIASHMVWMFYSVFFIRHIAESIQNETPYQSIFTYIAVVCAATLIISLHSYYAKHYVIHIDDVKIYRKLYGRIYLDPSHDLSRVIPDSPRTATAIVVLHSLHRRYFGQSLALESNLRYLL